MKEDQVRIGLEAIARAICSPGCIPYKDGEARVGDVVEALIYLAKSIQGLADAVSGLKEDAP